MSDYNYYIDSKSLTQANKAFDRDNYKVSRYYYEIALNRLLKYPGDKMYAIELGAWLRNQITISQERAASNAYKHIKQPDLNNIKPKSWILSKTSFIKGKQCEKYLYLDKHKRKEKTIPDEKTKQLFRKGHEFEELFRKTTFPKGINIKNQAEKWTFLDAYTSRFFDSREKITLFEATIVEEGVMIMADVIDKKNNNTYDFYEVKLYTELNEVVRQDLAIQYYICKKRYGDKIASFNVVLRKGEKDWKIINMKEEMEKRIVNMEETVKHFKTIIKGSEEPKVKMSNHCNNPYKCEFKAYCKK